MLIINGSKVFFCANISLLQAILCCLLFIILQQGNLLSCASIFAAGSHTFLYATLVLRQNNLSSYANNSLPQVICCCLPTIYSSKVIIFFVVGGGFLFYNILPKRTTKHAKRKQGQIDVRHFKPGPKRQRTLWQQSTFTQCADGAEVQSQNLSII